MYLPWHGILTLGCAFMLSQAQNLLYSDRRRSDRSYDRLSVSPFSVPHPINPYSGGLAGFYKQPSNKDVNLPSNRKAIRSYKSVSSYQNHRSSVPGKSPFTSNNSYANQNYKNPKNFERGSSSNRDIKSENISKADAENAKFVGAENQESDHDSRTLHFKHKKFHRRFNGALLNPCRIYGRDAGQGVTLPAKEQGRFLWDIHVNNYYPQSSLGLGCGGYGGFAGGIGGGGYGAGLLSDPVDSAYYPPGAGIANFLRLFAPGILQNSLAATASPQQLADYDQTVNNNDLHSDPEVDPNYRPGPVRRPNRVFYDSVGAPPVTPGQLVGGISTTVNGIIQQLTGNVQPVYG